MTCCGQNRNEWQQNNKLPENQDQSFSNAHTKMFDDVYFEYTGSSALSVTGNVSGKRYRFQFSGDKQLIDYRDASGMKGVPVLQKVKN